MKVLLTLTTFDGRAETFFKSVDVNDIKDDVLNDQIRLRNMFGPRGATLLIKTV